MTWGEACVACLSGLAAAVWSSPGGAAAAVGVEEELSVITTTRLDVRDDFRLRAPARGLAGLDFALLLVAAAALPPPLAALEAARDEEEGEGAELRHPWQNHLSGIFFLLSLAHLRWTQVRHSEHSIMGRPAKGFLQKQVTEFQPPSSTSPATPASSSSVACSGEEDGAACKGEEEGSSPFLKPVSSDDGEEAGGGLATGSHPLPVELPVEPRGELL